MTDPYRGTRCLLDRHCWRIELETAGLEDVVAHTVSDDVIFETVVDHFYGEDPFSGHLDRAAGFRFFRYECALERPDVVAGIVGEGA